MKVTFTGPSGAILALTSVNSELHGVKASLFYSHETESTITIFYVDGIRSSRKSAHERLSSCIKENEVMTLEGEMKWPE